VGGSTKRAKLNGAAKDEATPPSTTTHQTQRLSGLGVGVWLGAGAKTAR